MSEELAGARLRQTHEMLDFEVMIELRFLVGSKRSRLLAFDKIPDVLPCARQRAVC